MGVHFKFEAKIPNFEAKLRAAMPELRLFVAANMQTNRAMLFDKSGSHNGHEAWPAPKFRSGQPLKLTGTLAKSIGPKVSDPNKPVQSKGGIVRIQGDLVTIGTNLIYAAMMNWGTTKLPGGKLVAKNAQALAIPIPPGKKATAAGKKARKEHGNTMFVKSVKIPERRFDEWTAEDERELKIALGNKIIEVLKR